MTRLCRIRASEVPGELALNPTRARYLELKQELLAEAKALGLQLQLRPPAKTKLGSYDIEKNQAILNYRVGMTRANRLYVLAHEIRHAQHAALSLFDAHRFVDTHYVGQLMAKAGQAFKTSRERDVYCDRILRGMKLDPTNPYRAELDCDRWAFHWLLRRGVWCKEQSRHIYSYHGVVGPVLMSLSGRDGIPDNALSTTSTDFRRACRNRPHDRLQANERRYYDRLEHRLRLGRRL